MMIRYTIFTVFLFLLVISVKASPLPDPLPEAIAQNGLEHQSQVACPPAPEGYQPPQQEEDNGSEKPEEKARKKQEQEEAQRQKKEELRMQKEKMRERQDAERAKKDEERARKESNQKPPPPTDQGKENGNGGGSEGGVRGNTEQQPAPKQETPKQETPKQETPKQETPPPEQQGGGNNNNQGGNQGGSSGGDRPPPTQQSPPNTPVPNSAPVGDKVFRGPATFYGGALEGGNCMMKGFQLPPGVSGAAIGGNNWNNSANCGACAEVRGNGKKVNVVFVDQCSECGDGLDFFPDGFKQLADPSVGKFTVEWNFIKCPFDGPLKITDKEGTNEYYVAMQVQNAKEGTQSLEISADKGKSYKPTQRDSTNHFILNGGPVGAQNVDVKVTSKSGKVVVVPDVPVSGGGKEATQNYDG